MSVCVPGTFLRWDCGGVMQCNETAMRRELREKRRWRSRSVGRRADNVHGRRRASRKTLYKELRRSWTDGRRE